MKPTTMPHILAVLLSAFLVVGCANDEQEPRDSSPPAAARPTSAPSSASPRTSSSRARARRRRRARRATAGRRCGEKVALRTPRRREGAHRDRRRLHHARAGRPARQLGAQGRHARRAQPQAQRIRRLGPQSAERRQAEEAHRPVPRPRDRRADRLRRARHEGGPRRHAHQQPRIRRDDRRHEGDARQACRSRPTSRKSCWRSSKARARRSPSSDESQIDARSRDARRFDPVLFAAAGETFMSIDLTPGHIRITRRSRGGDRRRRRRRRPPPAPTRRRCRTAPHRMPTHFFVATLMLYGLVLGTFLLNLTKLRHAEPNWWTLVPFAAGVSFYIASTLFLLILGRGQISRWTVLLCMAATLVLTTLLCVVLRRPADRPGPADADDAAATADQHRQAREIRSHRRQPGSARRCASPACSRLKR